MYCTYTACWGPSTTCRPMGRLRVTVLTEGTRSSASTLGGMLDSERSNRMRTLALITNLTHTLTKHLGIRIRYAHHGIRTVWDTHTMNGIISINSSIHGDGDGGDEAVPVTWC